MVNSTLILFADKIEEVYKLDSESALKSARAIWNELPGRLLPNISEWSRGEPLSDIYIQEYSIPMILMLWQSKDFLSAVQVMIDLEKNPDMAVRKIWNMRR